MNNSKLTVEYIGLKEEETIDNTPWLRMREKEILEIIGAIQAISASNYWKILEQKIWNGVKDSLQNRLSKEKDQTEMYRLQGQIVWAEKYCDFAKLQDAYKLELTNLHKQLNAKRTTNNN